MTKLDLSDDDVFLFTRIIVEADSTMFDNYIFKVENDNVFVDVKNTGKTSKEDYIKSLIYLFKTFINDPDNLMQGKTLLRKRKLEKIQNNLR